MSAELSILSSGLDHPEGVAWSPSGRLACGGEAGQIYSVEVATGVSRQVAATGGFALGMAFDASDRLYVCDMGVHAVMRVDLESGQADDITTGGGCAVPVRIPNYPVFAADGSLFFSDSGDWAAKDGLIFVRTPDGRVQVATDQARGYANGLAIDPGGEYLYVVETSVPGISRFPVLGEGRLAERQLVVELPMKVPDGLAFTATGALVIACYRPDGLYLWDGSALETIVHDWTGLTLSAPTNVAFFGPGLDRLVAANLAGSHLVEIASGLTGAPLNYPELDLEQGAQ